MYVVKWNVSIQLAMYIVMFLVLNKTRWFLLKLSKIVFLSPNELTVVKWKKVIYYFTKVCGGEAPTPQPPHFCLLYHTHPLLVHPLILSVEGNPSIWWFLSQHRASHKFCERDYCCFSFLTKTKRDQSIWSIASVII